MAKNKRKTSSAQRDKNLISAAKKLKAAGILSKRANLHSGNYISKGVLKKTREYISAAELNYGTVKVSKELAQRAKERGYQVVQGNRIIGPKTPTFRNRLQKGELTGVYPIKGGMMEEVILPHTVFDMRSLVEQLRSGIDTLKEPGEQFAFRFHGNMSLQPLRDSEHLLEYLTTYKSMFDQGGSLRPEDLQEEFESLTIFRLHPVDVRSFIFATDKQKGIKKPVAVRKYPKGTTKKEAMQLLRANRTDAEREAVRARDRELSRLRQQKKKGK